MVFSLHLVYLSTTACISEKKKKTKQIWVHVGARILKGQRSSTNHKCYFLWVDAINKQSLSSHYLVRQQAPMVFSLHLVYLSTAACISEKNKVGSMWAQGFFRVKDEAKITKCYFLWVGAKNMQSLSGHYLMRQQVPMVFLLLLVYLGTGAYISVEISLGSFWCRDILRVKGQALLGAIIHKLQLLWLRVICNHGVVTTRCAIKYPRCLYFFSLSKWCCLHFCKNKFVLLLVQGYFKGQRSRIYHKLQLFMIFCDMQSLSGNYSMCHQVPMVFLLLLIYLSDVTCISEGRNLGPCWSKDILRVKGKA